MKKKLKKKLIIRQKKITSQLIFNYRFPTSKFMSTPFKSQINPETLLMANWPAATRRLDATNPRNRTRDSVPLTADTRSTVSGLMV